ncbi:glutathione S-transferase family protein [Yoonia sediminilitoris]|uniref:Glutathione S-transferase n=1 Tax=Yoonia sediminilitoris TaxID=1286148 RepID=A0A2T6KR72_9RHOB|nr:glutathione S-transferase family protein [Yoonia sediminilitoris]PUB19062.1 glutathione S-transferase [Yoonia sediminilitoris]RCW99230.1 glutathione S-transferase [Yoonia sediminilitoris]
MIRLHHCPQTRSMRSLWLLHELGVDFDLVEYPFDKTLREEPYASLNPTGRVPTLEIDGDILTESGAIAEFLCERFSDAGLGRAPGEAGRAVWLNWIHFAETISQHCATLTQQHVALRDDAMRSPILMQLEAKRLARTLATVEKGLTAPYLVGHFSAADVGVGQAVYMATHFVHLDTFPRLTDWYARLATRPAFQKSLPGETRLYARDFYPPWDVAT